MSFASVKKQPKSVRDQFKTASKKISNGIPTTIEKSLRRGNNRGNSLIRIKPDNESVKEPNPYHATAVAKSTTKPSFSKTGRGSSSLVRPKRITYGMHADGDLAPVDHNAAKQKLETLFVNKGVK